MRKYFNLFSEDRSPGPASPAGPLLPPVLPVVHLGGGVAVGRQPRSAIMQRMNDQIKTLAFIVFFSDL